MLNRLTLILCLSVNEQWCMGQMAVRCCRFPSRSTIVNRGCREFVLLFRGWLIPSFSLIINAPNASLIDLAGAPVRRSFEHILLQILTAELFGPWWPNDYLLPTRIRWGVQSLLLGLGHRETFRYTIAGGDARVLSHLTSNACFWLPQPRWQTHKTSSFSLYLASPI